MPWDQLGSMIDDCMVDVDDIDDDLNDADFEDELAEMIQGLGLFFFVQVLYWA